MAAAATFLSARLGFLFCPLPVLSKCTSRSILRPLETQCLCFSPSRFRTCLRNASALCSLSVPHASPVDTLQVDHLCAFLGFICAASCCFKIRCYGGPAGVFQKGIFSETAL